MPGSLNLTASTPTLAGRHFSSCSLFVLMLSGSEIARLLILRLRLRTFASEAFAMWFKVENRRSSIGQKFVVRCNSEIGGRTVVEERPMKGATAARKTAEILATSLNVTATV
jgi:hypothetical protein